VTALDAAGDLDLVDICVHTPLGIARQPDTSAIEAVGEALVSALRPGQLIVLTSTSYPGRPRRYSVQSLSDLGS